MNIPLGIKPGDTFSPNLVFEPEDCIHIPDEVLRSRKLNHGEKMLYGAVYTEALLWSSPPQSREIRNKTFPFMGQRQFFNLIRGAVSKEIIWYYETQPRDIEKLLRAKAPVQGIGDAICTWCGSTTIWLNAHHFPKTRKQGGTETVDICRNCHAEYHWAAARRYMPYWPLPEGSI